MSIRNLDQFVFGTGDDDKNSLAERIRLAWEAAKAPGMLEKLGKPCDIISIVVNIEGKDPRQLLNREVAITETPAAVAGWLRKELELDPGPSWVGTIRVYFRVFGAAENGKLGSYQREILATELPGDGSTPIIAIQTSIIMPLFQQVVNQSDASTRMLNAHAGVMDKLAAGLGTMLEILKGNRVADSGNPILAFLGQAMQAAGAGGVPGAAPAGRALTTMARSSGPPSWVPDIGSRTGIVKTAVPEFGVTGTDASSAPTARTTTTNGATTRADVDRWARENPAEAEAMVKDALRQKGFPIP